MFYVDESGFKVIDENGIMKSNKDGNYSYEGNNLALAIFTNNYNSNINKNNNDTNGGQVSTETYNELDPIKNSVSFKIGRMITFIPRKIRDIFRK